MEESLRFFTDNFASEYFKFYILLETVKNESQPDFYEPFVDVFHEYIEDKDEFLESKSELYMSKVKDSLYAVILARYKDIGKLFGVSVPSIDKPKSYEEFVVAVDLLRDFERECLQ